MSTEAAPKIEPPCRVCHMPRPANMWFGRDSLCCVCYSLRRFGKAPALEAAKKFKFSVGPFCRFCEDVEESLPCVWRGPVIGAVRTVDGRVGDIWITDQASKRGRIVEIVHKGIFGLRFWVKIPGHPKPYPYDRNMAGWFRSEVIGQCRKQACYRHQREVSEGRVICMDHWDGWMAAAELRTRAKTAGGSE